MPEWLTIVLPVAIAAIGLLGVLAAAVIAARSATRMRLYEANHRRADDFAAFQVRITAALNNLYTTSGAVLADLDFRLTHAKQQAVATSAKEFSVPLMEESMQLRTRQATDDWRKAMASAHMYPIEGLSAAISEIDNLRADFADLMNAGKSEEARRQLKQWNLQQVYRYLTVIRVQHDKTLLFTLQTLRLKREIKRAIRQLSMNEEQVQQRIDES